MMFDLDQVHPEVRGLFGDELRTAVRDAVRSEVRAGYRDAEAIVGEVFSFWEPIVDRTPAYGPLRLLISDHVWQEWAALEAEQLTWPEETDCDRLDRAFAALQRSGVAVVPYAYPDEVWTGRIDPPGEARLVHGKVSFDPYAVNQATRTGGLVLTYYASRSGDQQALRAEIVGAVRNGGAGGHPGTRPERAKRAHCDRQDAMAPQTWYACRLILTRPGR
jgi:hypothetical protein